VVSAITRNFVDSNFERALSSNKMQIVDENVYDNKVPHFHTWLVCLVSYCLFNLNNLRCELIASFAMFLNLYLLMEKVHFPTLTILT